MWQEEDFVAHTFGLPLQHSPAKKDKASEAQPVAALAKAEDELLDARRQSHQEAATSQADSTDADSTLQRLRFTKSLLEV